MTTNGTTNDNEWQRVVQLMATSGTASDNGWQRVTTSNKKWQVTANDNEQYSKWIRMKVSKIEWFYVSKETKGQSDSWINLFNFLCNI